MKILSALLLFSMFPSAPGFGEEKPAKTFARPALLEASDLEGFSDLSEGRQALLRAALETAGKANSKRYLFGGSDPAEGFDCSGAQCFVLQKAGFEPPRTSAQQFVWVREAGNLTLLSDKVESLDDEVFAKLIPGDLVFWSGTYVPTDGRTVKITHVGMYLGKEKKDGNRVMISASEGRSYRRVQSSGYGIQDFRLPSGKSRSKMVGFGSIPGIDGEKK